MIPAPPPLAGRTVALPESRELDQLSRLLEEQGATALRCPLVSILDAPDPAPVDAWLQRLIAGAFDDVIFLTGEGLRRLLARAARAGARARERGRGGGGGGRGRRQRGRPEAGARAARDWPALGSAGAGADIARGD